MTLAEEKKEEKEEKRKIRIISQIDDLIAIQGQDYMKGQLKEVLSYADKIISLAKPENLQSFIREQEDLIARVKGLQKQREEKKRAKIKAEQEKVRLEKIAKLKAELAEIEIVFNEAFKAEDLSKASEIIEQSKAILSNLDDDKVRKKWGEFEKKCTDAKVRKELVKSADELIAESAELKAKFEFEDLKLRLRYLIEQAKDKGITDYLKKLKELQTEILAAEKSYIKIRVKVEDLGQKTYLLQENKRYEEAITNCESLLELAKSIDLRDRIEEFSKILPQLKQNLKFEILKESVTKFNNEGLDFVRKGEISSSIEKFKLIEENLRNYTS